MKTLWDDGVASELVTRIQRLQPEGRPLWGRMSCPQMVAHVTDAFALYTGDLSCAGRRTPLQYPPLKQLFIYLLPIPKDVPTAAELIARVPGDWFAEIGRLTAAVESFAKHRDRTDWPAHPIFGRMSARAYGVLAYKHTDHHLRQFGV